MGNKKKIKFKMKNPFNNLSLIDLNSNIVKRLDNRIFKKFEKVKEWRKLKKKNEGENNVKKKSKKQKSSKQQIKSTYQKQNKNLTKSHIKNIQIIEELIAKNEKIDENFERVHFYIDNIINQIDTDTIGYERPEFLENPPMQMNMVSRQDTLEKIGLLKSLFTEYESKNNTVETKMTQLEKLDTNLPQPDTKLELNEEKIDTSLISDMNIEDKDESIKNKVPNFEKWFFTGVEGFDQLLEKGVPTGSNIIVAGGPGCGKTIFCMQVIYNKALEGKDCVLLSMEERPDRLKEHMLEFEFDVEQIKETDEEIILRAGGKGKIALKRLQPIRLARSIEALLEKASGTLPVDIDLVLDFIPEGFNAFLLALDSISAIETAFSGTKRQYRIYIEQLFRYFEDMNITTFMITESMEAPKRFSNTGVEEFLADGIFVFYNFQGVKKRTRGVEIFKLRGASHSQRIVPMNITSKGIDIAPDESCKEQA